MRVACVGDSITAAQHLRNDQAWPYLIAKQHGWTVRNFGVNGDTTRRALERFHMSVLEPADVFVIQFGLNDCNRWADSRGLPRVSLPSFRANLEELVDRARVLGDARHVVLMGMTPCLSGSLLDPGLYQQAIEQTAEEMNTRLCNPWLTDQHLLPDGVHLNEQGNRKLAGQLGEMLCQL